MIIDVKGQKVHIDHEDIELVSTHNWYIDFYGYATSTRTLEKMHRLIMKPQKGEIVDHINRDKLDNRKSNLRITNKSVNALNSKVFITNKSGYKGVSWFKRDSKWRAYGMLNYKQIHLGTFYAIEDAINARKKWEKDLVI